MHNHTHRITRTTTFVTPVVEHWLNGSTMKDRFDDPSHHERKLLPLSYISLPTSRSLHLAPYIHTYIHTHARTLTRMHIHIYIHTHTHTYTYIHTHMHTYTHIHTLTYIHIHTCIHTHTDIQHAYIHIHTHIYIHTFIHDVILLNTFIHIHTYIHTDIHTYTYIHSYTHSDVIMFLARSCLFATRRCERYTVPCCCVTAVSRGNHGDGYLSNVHCSSRCS